MSKAVWLPADKNRFGVPVLDLISVTGSVLSTTTDPQQAAMSCSWDGKLVADLTLARPAKSSIECSLRYGADRDLPDGWLFTPREMEHKWAIAYRGGSIWILRSWTGEVSEVCAARRDGDELVVERVEFGDDHFKLFGDPIDTFDWLLRSHALDEVLPLPVTEDAARILENKPLAIFPPYGHVAKCAAIGWTPSRPTRPLRTCGDVATAVRIGDATRVAALAKSGASLTSREPRGGFTPLHIAAIQGSVEITRLLLELGADPNALADRDQSVAILAVVRQAPIELLDLLVSRGADLTRANRDGFGLVHAIAETNQPAYLPWALANRASLETRTRHGHTPLHIAAGLGHVAAIEALVAAGADRDARDASGKTAREIAMEERKPEAVAALS